MKTSTVSWASDQPPRCAALCRAEGGVAMGMTSIGPLPRSLRSSTTSCPLRPRWPSPTPPQHTVSQLRLRDPPRIWPWNDSKPTGVCGPADGTQVSVPSAVLGRAAQSLHLQSVSSCHFRILGFFTERGSSHHPSSPLLRTHLCFLWNALSMSELSYISTW